MASNPPAKIKVPFYANHAEGGRSMLAVYRMVIKALAYKELSWDELDGLSGHRQQRKVWTVRSLFNIADAYGLSVKMIEPFDYIRLAKEGKDYLYEMYDNEEADWYDEHSNVAALGIYLSQFLAAVRPHNRRASLEDIDDMLDEGRLVSVTVDGTILAGAEGEPYHAILITGKRNQDYIVHDPGPPTSKDQHVSRDLLWQAMGGDNNIAEVTGFMKRKVGIRLDQYVIREKPTLSRAYATRLITEGKITVNSEPNKPGYKLRQNDEIVIGYDEADEPAVPDIDLPVLYEDDDCIVIDKPAGVLTHNKGVRFVEATVASFVRSRSKLNEGERPGIVHRLDRATSGVMICAKTPEALSFLQKQFHDRLAQKSYAAIIQGELEPAEAIIDMPIERNPKAPATFRVGPNGKVAQTHYQTVRTAHGFSLLELRPRTGRTHQLRVHLAYQHHPIVGDTIYDGQAADRMYLHAHQLTIAIPNGQTKTFTAAIPPAFERKLDPTI